MKRTNKTFMVSILIAYSLIMIFIGVIVFNVYQGLQIERALDQEFIEIEYLIDNKGLSDNSIDIKLNNFIASGDYLYVEMAVKEYLKDILYECRRLENIYTNYELNTVLYLYNFDEDAPYFEYSKKIINDSRISIEEINSNLVGLLEVSKIKSYIEKYKLDKYFIDYYEEIMIDQVTLNNNKEEIEKSINYSISLLNAYTDYFTFLSDNADYWTMDDDYIYFENDELLEEYNYLLNIINNMDLNTDIESYI